MLSFYEHKTNVNLHFCRPRKISRLDR